MMAWNEDTIRKASAWKAFKEGRMLADFVSRGDVQLQDDGWQGVVRTGKKAFRVRVRVHSPTNIDVACGCPDNRATGEMCAHAVALGLAALKGDVTTAAPPVAKADAVESPVLAFDVMVSAKWREELRSARLSVTLKVVDSALQSEPDRRLNGWLSQKGLKVASSQLLQLRGEDLVQFLLLLEDHPRVRVAADVGKLQVGQGMRMRLTERAEGDALILEADDSGGGWFMLATNEWWFADEGTLIRAGDRPIDSGLLPLWQAWIKGESVSVPLADLMRQIPAWQSWLELPPDGVLSSLRGRALEPSFELTLDGSLQALEARLAVAYADLPGFAVASEESPGLPRLRHGIWETRDLGRERAAIARLERHGFRSESGRWLLNGESSVMEFLKQGWVELRNDWKVTQGARFTATLNQVEFISPRFEILSGDSMSATFDFKFQTSDGELISVQEVRQLLRSGKRSRNGSAKHRVVIDGRVEELIEPLFSDLGLHQSGQHYEATGAAVEVIHELCKKIDNPQHTNRLSSISESKSIAGFTAELRDYQAQGVDWLSDRLKRFGGALLADDMGLGKTVQTIALIERLFLANSSSDGVVLVVVMTSLLGNWQREFERFAPGRRVRIMHGSGRDREREKIGAGEVVLTTYGTVARDQAWHLRQRYLAVVVDEASVMRNPDTDHARILSRLEAQGRVALTGTPIENGVRDLWSIFRFIQPGWLGGRQEFTERYAGDEGGKPAAMAIERLRLKISPFVLRRTKDQVAPELPSKCLIDEICDLGSDQREVYAGLVREGRRWVEEMKDAGQDGAARMQVLTLLLRLRQACCDLTLLGQEKLAALPVEKRSTKMVRLLELLREAIDGGHKVLVFSQFQKQLLAIEQAVRGHGWDCLRLDGQTTRRQEMVNRFQSPDGPPIFLISLKAGGYGLNLTAADIVIHFDPWWNPAAEAQATDRAHRIGQARPVTVYRLLTAGTVEEKVVSMQRQKRELAAMIDEAGVADAAGWTMAELQSLLRGA